MYVYDGDGTMVKSIINGVSTYFTCRHYNLEVNGTTSIVQKTYAFGSLSIAVRNDGVLKWLLSDHLSSTSITANEDGSLNSEIRYSAFGEVRYSSGTTPTDYQYTNQLNQPDIGLYYYVARFYDPVITHFVQADTIVPGAGNPAAYDRYAYVQNDPIRLNDPSGHDPSCLNTSAWCLSAWDAYGRWGSSFYNQSSNNNIGSVTTSSTGSNSNSSGGNASQNNQTGNSTTSSNSTNQANTPTIVPDNTTKSWISGTATHPNNCYQTSLLNICPPDAFIFGFIFSGDAPGINKTAGMEELVLNNGNRATYNFMGEGVGYGVGVSAAPYAGFVWNIDDVIEYTGPFTSHTVSGSWGEWGITGSYFYDSYSDPLSPDTIKGISIGWAPGAKLSYSNSGTIYSMTFHDP